MENPVFEIAAEAPAYRVYWQDEAKTICVIQALADHWTWDEAIVAVRDVDTTVRTVEHTVHVIYQFETGKGMIPRGGGLIGNLRSLMRYYAPNTAGIVFVKSDPSLKIFIQIVMNTFQILGRNYRFVETMEKAQELIEADRQKQAASV